MKWEYLKLTNCESQQLDRLGDAGWELVSFQIDRRGGLSWEATEIYIFKRQVKD